MTHGEGELRQAQRAAEYARRFLLFPSLANLDRSRELLEQACASLGAVERSAGAPGAPRRELLAGLGTLRQTVRRAAALLESAARFQAGWSQLLLTRVAGGYTREGTPVTAALPRSLSVEG